jgi:hypothetical protein
MLYDPRFNKTGRRFQRTCLSGRAKSPTHRQALHRGAPVLIRPEVAYGSVARFPCSALCSTSQVIADRLVRVFLPIVTRRRHVKFVGIVINAPNEAARSALSKSFNNRLLVTEPAASQPLQLSGHCSRGVVVEFSFLVAARLPASSAYG